MARLAAGLLMYRRRATGLEVLLVHPGGPYWAHKDDGAWTLPKGEHGADEQPIDAAKREFREETGMEPRGELHPLGSVRLRSGKTIAAWAFAGDCDPATLCSNSFSMEWPPRSGQQRSFPEIDRAAWFPIVVAGTKLIPAQRAFLDRLVQLLGG